MIKLANLLTEQSFDGKTFISVDVQPEYENAFSFNIYEFTKFINDISNEVNKIVFLYNGEETIGGISEERYKFWLYENQMNEDVIDSITFYDKGYAFFRYCMDSYLDDDITVNFVKFMYDNNIRDSRYMTRDMWAKYLRLHRHTDKKEAYELLDKSSDCVNIPELMDFLKRYRNIILCGGSINECLREVEIALMALRLPYDIYHRFTY